MFLVIGLSFVITTLPVEEISKAENPVLASATDWSSLLTAKESVSDSLADVKVADEAKIVPTVSSGNSIEEIVRQAARSHGIDENYFVHIARCESTLNPNAVNTSYNENGNPSGLFQHISGYWPARAAKYGYAGASVFDAVANANVTAAMFSEGLEHLWECK